MSQLTLTFLGVGSAFAKRIWQSNALIEFWRTDPESQRTPDDTLLIDFGTTGPLALHALKHEPGFEYLDADGWNNYPAIKRVLVTHQHADHAGGLEELAFVNRHVFGKPDARFAAKPQLVSSAELLANLWNHTLSGGLGAIGGRAATLDDYFRPHAVKPHDGENPDRLEVGDRFEIVLVPTDHVRIEEAFDWPSFAVLVSDRTSDETVFYSSDTRFDPRIIEQCVAPSRLCFHDVQLIDEPEPVHALLSELRTLPESTRRKMCLYHYGDNWDDPAYDFVEREFAGFARQHQRYLLFD